MISILQNFEILNGIITAGKLFFFTIIFAIPFGIILAIGRISKYKSIAKIVQFYIWLVRGTPLMLQLIFVYFGLDSYGFGLNRFTAAVITFVFNYAAYFAEIFRGGLQSIERVQYESADVLGLNYKQKMLRIILPQTIKRILPSVANEVICLIKDTSLAQVIGIVEIFAMVKIAAARDFVIYPFFIAAVFYLGMTYLLTKIFNLLEKKYAYYE